MWRIEREVGDQRFGKTLHCKFCRAIGSVRTPRPERGPKAIDAAGVDDVALVRLLQQWQKGPRAEIDPVPADAKRPFPFCTAAIDEASTAANAGIVEQQMDVIGVEIA